jgi:hypothetical protein
MEAKEEDPLERMEALLGLKFCGKGTTAYQNVTDAYPENSKSILYKMEAAVFAFEE